MGLNIYYNLIIIISRHVSTEEKTRQVLVAAARVQTGLYFILFFIFLFYFILYFVLFYFIFYFILLFLNYT